MTVWSLTLMGNLWTLRLAKLEAVILLSGGRDLTQRHAQRANPYAKVSKHQLFRSGQNGGFQKKTHIAMTQLLCLRMGHSDRMWALIRRRKKQTACRQTKGPPQQPA